MSRRKSRYLRRQQKRKFNQLKRCEDIGGIGKIFTYYNLYKYGRECCKGVRWKNSTQRFEMHLFSETAKRRNQLLKGKWKAAPYVHFTISERGKTRPIDAPRIQDRQIHKTFTKEALLPLYLPQMIYNNGASLKGKGYHFSSGQLKKDLRWHYRRYGKEGSIILIDFQKFFPTVSHETIFKRHERLLLNKEVKEIADKIVSVTNIGMPLGVEPSQVEMIAFPSALDNYIKCQLSLKCAGHYMDDYYIIVPPNRNVKEIFELIKAKANSLQLTINLSKSKITPLTKPFKYCKAKYTITNTGKIIVNGCRKNLVRDRRKIKKFKDFVTIGKMSYLDLWPAINGIFNYFEKYNDHNRILKLRRLFYSLFGFSCEQFINFKLQDKIIMSKFEDL